MYLSVGNLSARPQREVVQLKRLRSVADLAIDQRRLLARRGQTSEPTRRLLSALIRPSEITLPSFLMDVAKAAIVAGRLEDYELILQAHTERLARVCERLLSLHRSRIVRHSNEHTPSCSRPIPTIYDLFSQIFRSK